MLVTPQFLHFIWFLVAAVLVLIALLIATLIDLSHAEKRVDNLEEGARRNNLLWDLQLEINENLVARGDVHRELWAVSRMRERIDEIEGGIE
jgi:3-oxoacyl-ACP reductase-like protein